MRRGESGPVPVLTGGITLLAAIFLLAPIAVIVPMSFTDQTFLGFPQESWSLRHYDKLLSDGRWLSALDRSLWIGLCASLAATLVGTCCAIGLWLSNSRLVSLVGALVFLPLIVPAIIHALGFYRLWVALDLIDSFLAMVVTHMIIILPLAIVAVGAALSQLDRRLYQSAVSLGAPLPTVVLRVLVPNLRLGIFGGFVLCMITSWDEVVASGFVAQRQMRTLPLEIWSSLRERVDPSVAAASVLMIGATLLLVLIARPWRASGRR